MVIISEIRTPKQRRIDPIHKVLISDLYYLTLHSCFRIQHLDLVVKRYVCHCLPCIAMDVSFLSATDGFLSILRRISRGIKPYFLLKSGNRVQLVIQTGATKTVYLEYQGSMHCSFIMDSKNLLLQVRYSLLVCIQGHCQQSIYSYCSRML
jgi:hypothetical protein